MQRTSDSLSFPLPPTGWDTPHWWMIPGIRNTPMMFPEDGAPTPSFLES